MTLPRGRTRGTMKQLLRPLTMTRPTMKRQNHHMPCHRFRHRAISLLAALTAAASSNISWADTSPILELEASVSQQTANDQMRVHLVSESRGSALEQLNSQILKTIDGALQQARAYPSVRAWAGSINTAPLHRNNGQRTDQWIVRGTLTLESTDTEAISKLATSLARSLQIEDVSYRLSTPRRQAEEKQLIQQVADAFRAKARITAEAFGYKRYDIKHLQISTQYQSDSDSTIMPLAASARSADAGESTSGLATAGGDTTITLSAQGSIELH